MGTNVKRTNVKLRTLVATVGGMGLLVLTLLVTPTLGSSARAAAATPVPLGAACSYPVLAGSTITNTGSTVITGDLGLSPGTAVTGFPPGTVSGTQNVANPAAVQAKSDLTTAYDNAAGQTPATTVAGDLGGQTLTPGVYNSGSSIGLTGTLTLDAGGDANAVFIFQAGSTLVTASASQVNLINGAQSRNVFWQVGSSATLGANSTFRGTILALTSITVTTGVSVDGRVLARNGAVTLDTNTITKPQVCTSAAPEAAAATPVPLGAAGSYPVLAGSTITNTGSTVITGDLGLSPGTAVTGFPPGTVSGTQNVANPAAVQAKSDLTTAYDNAAGQTPATTVPTELGGTTLTHGVYNSAAGTFGITGILTLDAGGDANAVFIFQAGSTLVTASASQVNLINGAQSCNVFWQVGSSATLGTSSTFRGTILALTSITVTTDVTVDGRVLARNGAVTLDTNTITKPQVCATA